MAKAGRPSIKNRPMTQAERTARWKVNLKMRALEARKDPSLPKKRINLSIAASTIDSVEILANVLGCSTTEMIERLLYRGSQEADKILQAYEDCSPEEQTDEETMSGQKWLKFAIRAGLNAEEVPEAYERFLKDNIEHK